MSGGWVNHPMLRGQHSIYKAEEGTIPFLAVESVFLLSIYLHVKKRMKSHWVTVNLITMYLGEK